VTDPLHVLAEPNRQRILQLVWDRELAAGEIAARFDVTFGAVSQHLRVLREAGLVSVRRSGRRRLYRVRKQALGPLGRSLEAMWTKQLASLARLAAAEAEKTKRN
jgi:DNA-binding transcriptional ArsR family regulator